MSNLLYYIVLLFIIHMPARPCEIQNEIDMRPVICNSFRRRVIYGRCLNASLLALCMHCIHACKTTDRQDALQTQTNRKSAHKHT